MRITTLAIAGAVAACVAMPAVAATKKSATRSWQACDTLAMQRGVVEGERRSTDTGPSSWRQFMVACLAGKIADAPVVAVSQPRVPGPPQRVTSKWQSCETLAMQRGINEEERRSSDTGPSPFGQFMRACMEGKVH